MHLDLRRSLGSFDGRCSLRTWVYRVAHNVGASHLMRNRRISAALVGLDAVEVGKLPGEWRLEANRRLSAATLLDLLYRLKPLDRQVVLLYLESEAAAAIGETVGLTASNVATKIHRIKKLLRRQHDGGGVNAGG